MPAIPSWLLEPLWDQFVVPLPDRPVHDPAPRKATRSISRAALACRTNARHNTFNRLQRCHERREEVIDAFFDLTEASSTVRNLIRQEFLPPGLKGGGQLVAHPLRGMGARAGHPETWWPSRCPAKISGVTSCRSPGQGGSTRRWRRRPGSWRSLSRVRRFPAAASKAREPCEMGLAAVAAACVRRRRCPGRAVLRHRAPRVRRPGSPAGGRRSQSRG